MVLKWSAIIFGIFLCSYVWSQEISTTGKIDKIIPQLDVDTLHRIAHSIDTLNPLAKRIDSVAIALNTPNKYVDSIQLKLDQKVSSLTKLTILPSIQLDSDTTGKKLSRPDQINRNISAAVDKVQSKADSITGILHNKVEGLAEKEEYQINGIVTDQLNIPKDKLPQLSTGELSSVPNVQIPDANLPDIKTKRTASEMPATSIPGISSPDIRHASIPKLDNLQMSDDIGKVKEKTATVTEKLNGAEQYQGEIKKIQEQGLPSSESLAKEAEDKVENLEEVKSIKQGTGKVSGKQAEYDAMMQRYRDKKLIQEELKRKITNVANDEVNKFSPAIKEAQAALLKGKKIQKESTSIKEILKREYNSMAGKPLVQRLVPGVMLQLYNRKVYSVDFGLQLGYRLSGRITTGVGGVYRFGFHKDYSVYVQSMHVYGLRTYTNLFVKKGFFVHAEAEWLKTSGVAHASNEQPSERVIGGNFGVGKQYNLTRRIRGNMLVLYRAEFEGNLPQQGKVNLRVGLNMQIKKKKKSNVPA